MRNEIYCSFCGKNQREVRWVVAGPGAYICGECVDVCVAQIAESEAAKQEKRMTEDHKPLSVAGYTAQPDAKVALVNSFKEEEERLLRKLDELAKGQRLQATENGYTGPGEMIQADMVGIDVDQRWLAIAKTDFQRAYMALNRAVFQPQRIRLPEDGE